MTRRCSPFVPGSDGDGARRASPTRPRMVSVRLKEAKWLKDLGRDRQAALTYELVGEGLGGPQLIEVYVRGSFISLDAAQLHGEVELRRVARELVAALDRAKTERRRI